MSSKSPKQQKFFQLVRSIQKGETSPGKVNPNLRKAAKSISSKDAEDFANSVAEWKQKKTVLSILKDIREPMYLNEEETNPVAKTFTEKSKFEDYVRRFIGQPLSPKESEAINTFKEAKPTKVTRNEIRYENSDDFSNSTTTVIKKLKEGQQFVFTSFQKHTPIKDEEPEQSTVDPFGSQPSSEQPQENPLEDADEIIVTKSVAFVDEIKGGAVLAEFLKKLDI